MTMRITRRRALTLGTMALATTAGCTGPAPARPAPSPDDHPLSGLTDFEGNALPPPTLTGRVTVLDFWASWCAPCRVEFRYLDQLYQTFRKDGLALLGVSIDDDPRAAENFRAFSRPHFPVGWDASGAIRERFQVVSLPTTILVDTKGQIAYRKTGFTPDDHRFLEDHVRRMLRP
jgi:thiol-disulfide isomerase/thioredoxin